jgi:hypothetical protein
VVDGPGIISGGNVEKRTFFLRRGFGGDGSRGVGTGECTDSDVELEFEDTRAERGDDTGACAVVGGDLAGIDLGGWTFVRGRYGCWYCWWWWHEWRYYRCICINWCLYRRRQSSITYRRCTTRRLSILSRSVRPRRQSWCLRSSTLA